MKVFVNIKQAGKRKAVLSKKECSIDPSVSTLRQVLEYFTRIEATKFNSRDEESYLLYADEDEIEDLAGEGKIGFGYKHNGKQVDPEDAVGKTIESFNDGLVRVFLNDNELTQLDEPAVIKEKDEFTFIRFTFLTGRMW